MNNEIAAQAVLAELRRLPQAVRARVAAGLWAETPATFALTEATELIDLARDHLNFLTKATRAIAIAPPPP